METLLPTQGTALPVAVAVARRKFPSTLSASLRPARYVSIAVVHQLSVCEGLKTGDVFGKKWKEGQRKTSSLIPSRIRLSASPQASGVQERRDEQEGAALSGDENLEPEILKPLETSSVAGAQDVLLVLLPGALTPPDAYLPLAHAIQAASGLRLWVGILNFIGNVATDVEIRKRYEGLKERLKGMGFKDGSRVYFAGHSLGAFVGRTAALQLADGFIQMGSWFNPAMDNLREYPKPVLSLGGEYDGQIPVPTFAAAAQEVAAGRAQLGEDYLLANKPVIIVEGMNHAQFSHGIMNIQRGDWEPTIPIEEARVKVARVVAAFLAVQLEGKEAKVGSEEAVDVLREEVQRSEKEMRPFWEARESEKEGWEPLQAHLLNLAVAANEVAPFSTTILWHSFPDNFIYSKPWIDVEKRTVFAQAKLQQQGKYGLSSTLWIKLKSPEAIQLALGSPGSHLAGGRDADAKDPIAGSGATEAGSANGLTGTNGQVSPEDPETVKKISAMGRNPYLHRVTPLPKLAADMNARVFAKALELCGERARRRYEAHGKKLKFIEDNYDLSSVKWIESDVALVPSDKEPGIVEVQSPVMVTPATNFPPRFAGMYYLKLLTVARAMDWIMVDAFR